MIADHSKSCPGIYVYMVLTKAQLMARWRGLLAAHESGQPIMIKCEINHSHSRESLRLIINSALTC